MATLAPEAAVRKKLYNVIRGDTELQSLLGSDFNIYWLNAGEDPSGNYMVDDISLTELSEVGKSTGDYVLNYYYIGRDQGTIWDVNRRLKILLHEQRYTTENVYFRIRNDIMEPATFEDLKEVQHYYSVWTLNVTETELIEEINTR